MNADDQIATGIEREKWHIERAFRERELAIKEGELGLRRKEQAGSGWRNPLVVAILAATACGRRPRGCGRCKRSLAAGFGIRKV